MSRVTAIQPQPLAPGAEIRSTDRYLVPLLNRRQQAKYGLIVTAWIAAVAFLWLWWLQPDHNIGTGRFVFATVMLFWICFLPLYYIAIFLRAKEPSRSRPVPKDLRVAMVVTKAPSEPFPVVRRTLEAMLAQDYPHDTWLADEKPDAETRQWCAAHGVKISTREGRADYHRPVWPRRTRCKEGNLAFFYDHFGYSEYDVVAQLDADHVPAEGYLREIVRPFADPEVGYVSAPSICDSNAASSWSARSRLYAEAMFHGTLQSGYTGGLAPMCIGSHYAVRTSALQQSGGLGPELAEDHSTSMILSANGWRGVHAIRAIANGDGPQTFADLVTQEFQWSRSLVTLLLQHTPRYCAGLPMRLKFQFVFCQLWYPLFAIIMALIFLMPMLALWQGTSFVGVTYPQFLLHMTPMGLVLFVLAWQLKRDGLFRPYDAKVFSWERALFPFAQWPWVLAGSVLAVTDTLRGRFVDFRITPKGGEQVGPAPYRVLVPYLILSAASAATALVLRDVGEAAGFYLFAAMNAFIYALLLVVIVVRHSIENGVPLRPNWARIGFHGGVAAMATTLSISVFAVRGIEGLDVLSQGTGPLALTEVTYSASGAGSGRRGLKHVKLKLDWNPNRDN